MTSSDDNMELQPTSSDWALEEGEIIVFEDAETENSAEKGEPEKQSSGDEIVGKESPTNEKRSASKASEDPRSTKKVKDQSYERENRQYKERDENDSAYDRKHIAQRKRSESKGRKYNQTRGRPYNPPSTRRSYKSPSPPRHKRSYRSPSPRSRRSYRSPSPRARRYYRSPSNRRYYRSPSPQYHYSERHYSGASGNSYDMNNDYSQRQYSGASGNSHDMNNDRQSYKYRGDYSYNSGEKHSSPRNDKPGQLKIVTKPTVQKKFFPEDYLAKIDSTKEKHIFVTDSTINQDAKNTAGEIEIRDYPHHAIEELAEEVVNIVNNHDTTSHLYLTVSIFDREFERLGQTGIENTVSIFERVKTDKRVKEKIHLTLATLPFHPFREHIWPEIEIANNFLKEETVAMGAPIFNLHSWLQKPGKFVKDKMCKGTLYSEFVGKRGLGMTLNHEGQDKLISGLIRHCSRANTADLGDMSQKGKPVPLNETGGYKLYPSTSENKWLCTHMGYMAGLVINEEKKRQAKIDNLQLKVNNDKVKTDESEVSAGAKAAASPKPPKKNAPDSNKPETVDKPEAVEPKQLTTAEPDADDPQDSSSDDDSETDSDDNSENEKKSQKKKIENLKSILKFKNMEVKMLRGANKEQEQQLIEEEKALKDFRNEQESSAKKTMENLKTYEDQYDRDQQKIKDLNNQQANHIKEADYLRARLKKQTDQCEDLNKEKKVLEKDLEIKQDLIDTLKKSILNMSKKLEKAKRGKYDE
jgi:hypothetical protein